MFVRGSFSRWGLVTMLGAVPQFVSAHPFHVSIAEVEFRRDRNVLEVSLRVDPADLERALTRRSGRSIDIARAPEADALIASYLEDVFVISFSGVKPAPLRWVGKEVLIQHAWLFFELSTPKTIDRATLSNRIFLELAADQENTVIFKNGGDQRTLRFTNESQTAVLDGAAWASRGPQVAELHGRLRRAKGEGDAAAAVRAHVSLGRFYAESRDAGAAASHLLAATESIANDSDPLLPICLDATGILSCALGDLETAVRFHAAAARLSDPPTAVETPSKERRDNQLQSLRRQLGDNRFRKAVISGNALTRDEARRSLAAYLNGRIRAGR